MTTVAFLERFQEFLGRNGWRTDQSPWTLVEQWNSLVDQAATGYHLGYYEFANDLAVRDLLAKAFADTTLSQYDHVAVMRQQVEQVDARLRRLLLPNTEIGGADQPWWRRGVLAAAGHEYTQDIERLWGIKLEA